MPKPQIVYRPADTGPAFWGPGDRYTFLVTGAQTGGAYFVMEEGFFEETLEPAIDRNAVPPENNSTLAERFVAAAARYGLEFVPLRQATAA